MSDNIKIEDLGYNSFFKTSDTVLKLDGFDIARVIAEFKEAYAVKNTSQEYFARITGKQIFEASDRVDYPAVGDWVAINVIDNNQAIIHKILPRHTILARKHGDKNRQGEKNDIQIIATNINVAFIVESVDRDYSLNRIERYLSIAQDGGIETEIILNKIDLISREDLAKKKLELETRFPNIGIIYTSTVNNNGINELQNNILKGTTYCFLGSSGVGKSTLINRLLKSQSAETAEISSSTSRGRHTTTQRQMYFLANGGIVIDNPGIREVGVLNTNQGLNDVFNQISEIAQYCKFSNCTHTNEPGCQVIESVKSGVIDHEKFANYLNLRKEVEYYEMNDLDKKYKDRQFGKFKKNAIKDLEKYANKY